MVSPDDNRSRPRLVNMDRTSEAAVLRQRRLATEHNKTSSPLVRLPPELRNLIYEKLDVIERETFGPRQFGDRGKIIDFPRPLASTCRLFYYELADIPFSLNSRQLSRLCMTRRLPSSRLKTVRILARKHTWEKKQERLFWDHRLFFQQFRRLHVCVLLDARSFDDWRNDPYRPLWESDVRRELREYLPCVEEVVFEWEIEVPKVDARDARDAREKTSADVVKE